MANQILLLRSLSPLEALQVLARATASVSSGEGLDQVRVRVWTPRDDASDLRVNLTVPDPGARMKAGPRKLYEAIDAQYRQILPDSAEYRPPPENYQPLRDSLPELLRARAFNDTPARRIEQEYLVVVPGVDMAQAGEIFQRLALFATSTSVAPLARRDRGPLHLFRVLHDRQRGSAFTSLIPSEITSPLLAGYEAGEWVVFADPGQPPGRAALGHFADLLRHAPGLLDEGPPPASANGAGRRPLAALVRWPGDTPELELLYLRHLSFVGQVNVEPHQHRYSSVSVSVLTESPQAEARLRDAIGDAAFRAGYSVGYSLTLRKAREIHDLQRERARLQAQREDVENRLEYLDSIEPPRPRLLRFTEEQLPALGDYVGSFPIRVIEAGAIRYAFQSLSADGAGMHYLLVDPRTAPLERIDPLPAWEQGSTPIGFWLDPHWARYYHGRGDSLVFVPKHTYLSPLMHPPSPDAMDDYLRAIVGQWFHGRAGAPAVPQAPLYMFEPDARSNGQLVLTVLDADAFVPLTQKLDWVNAHLHLRLGRRRGDEILRQIDEDMSAEEILGALERSANSREGRMSQALQRSAAHVAGATGALTDLLSATLDEVLKKSWDTRKTIAASQQQLRTLLATEGEVSATLAQTGAAIDETAKATAQANATTETLRRDVEAALLRAKDAHAEAERQIRTLETIVLQLGDRLAQR